ncbi:hypothetical protein swp_3578 [Shewanella piezotolerans WP3]|uniref:Uncharacterized protein n=1 Tax=Shewanella piezotolerans (strain WP3 / JCM 13877) TaxID=225849 RepID=B8CQD9_SHEPW|nr:hypothetical protein swp_3578 [Shewanella piezotolerans WP3]
MLVFHYDLTSTAGLADLTHAKAIRYKVNMDQLKAELSVRTIC